MILNILACWLLFVVVDKRDPRCCNVLLGDRKVIKILILILILILIQQVVEGGPGREGRREWSHTRAGSWFPAQNLVASNNFRKWIKNIMQKVHIIFAKHLLIYFKEKTRNRPNLKPTQILLNAWTYYLTLLIANHQRGFEGNA